MQKTESSLSILADTVNQLSDYHRLDLAEYAAVAGSAVGSIVAGLSGQILWAATPLTLALTLNLVNRQRVELETRLQNSSAIAEVHQIVESLSSTVEDLPRSERLGDVEASLIRLSEAIAEIQQRVDPSFHNSEPFDSPKIREEFAVLRRALMRLRDHTDASFTEFQKTVAQEMESLRSVKELPTVAAPPQVGEMGPELAQLRGEFAQLHAEFQTLTNRPTLDVAPLEVHIHDIHQQVAKLQQDNREIVKPYLKHLVRAVKKIEADRAE